jgi:hypothetical protein
VEGPGRYLHSPRIVEDSIMKSLIGSHRPDHAGIRKEEEQRRAAGPVPLCLRAARFGASRIVSSRCSPSTVTRRRPTLDSRSGLDLLPYACLVTSTSCTTQSAPAREIRMRARRKQVGVRIERNCL